MPRRSRRGLAIVTVKGRPSLYLRGTVAGCSVFESTGTDRLELAEEKRSAREAEIYRAAVHGPGPARRSFAEAVLGYIRDRQPSEATKARVGTLLRHYGPRCQCHDIDQDRIDRAAEAILRPGYAPATKLREIVTPTRAVLQWAAVRGWCAVPAFERGSAGRARVEWLTPDEVKRHIAAAEKHLRPLLTFLYATGARLSEALELEWQHVDLQHARAVLRDVKDRDVARDRIVPLPPRVVAALANLPHREGVVFRQRRGREYADRERRAGGQIRKGWAGALARAGITKPITPHGARHTWASWHYAVHRDLLLLRHAGDWSSVTLVERYAHLVPPGLAPQIKAWMSAPSVTTATDTPEPIEKAG